MRRASGRERYARDADAYAIAQRRRWLWIDYPVYMALTVLLLSVTFTLVLLFALVVGNLADRFLFDAFGGVFSWVRDLADWLVAPRPAG